MGNSLAYRPQANLSYPSTHLQFLIDRPMVVVQRRHRLEACHKEHRRQTSLAARLTMALQLEALNNSNNNCRLHHTLHHLEQRAAPLPSLPLVLYLQTMRLLTPVVAAHHLRRRNTHHH